MCKSEIIRIRQPCVYDVCVVMRFVADGGLLVTSGASKSKNTCVRSCASRKPRGFWRTLGQSGVAQPLRLAAGRVYLPAAACKTVCQFTSAPFQIQTNRGYSVGSLRLFAAGSTNLPLKNRKSAPAGQALPVQSSAKKPSTNCKARNRVFPNA